MQGMVRAYYNENDPKTAAWLGELIARGHLPAGDVDTRSIVEVRGSDIVGYGQCHFFAGIGGWPYALRLAGWGNDRPAWTGSCPCQPFSAAGQRRGTSDERHLWPEFHRLIAECSPPVVFGEQVASKDGREWLAGVRADLEALGYGVGAADLCAAGAGAPHIRQRLFWMGDAGGTGLEGRGVSERGGAGEWIAGAPGSDAGGLGFTDSAGSQPGLVATQANGHGRSAFATGDIRGVADAEEARCVGGAGLRRRSEGEGNGPSDGFWLGADWLPCTDGKARRVEPGTFPLAHGVPARVGRLRGYGNAIVPQVAAEFIRACTG